VLRGAATLRERNVAGQQYKMALIFLYDLKTDGS